MAKSSILERDIEFYTSCIENITTQLSRCLPCDEEKYQKEREIYKKILSAMQELKEFYA